MLGVTSDLFYSSCRKFSSTNKMFPLGDGYVKQSRGRAQKAEGSCVCQHSYILGEEWDLRTLVCPEP